MAILGPEAASPLGPTPELTGPLAINTNALVTGATIAGVALLFWFAGKKLLGVK